MADEGFFKQIYTGLEDSYYGFCDFLQNQVKIPIYDAFVTPVESKGIPSFPLFIALLLVLIVGGYFAFQYAFPGSTSVKVSVMQAGSPLAGVPVTLQIDGKEFGTLQSDENGLVNFENVPVGKNGKIVIMKEGFAEFEKDFKISKTNPEISASLEQVCEDCEPSTGNVRVTVKIRDESGVPVSGATIAYFDSESGTREQGISDVTGMLTLIARNQNSELAVTVTKSNYQAATASVVVSSEKTKTVTLVKSSAVTPDNGGTRSPKGEVLVLVVDENGNEVDATVRLVLAATDDVLDSDRTIGGGKVRFENIDAVGARVYVVVEPRDDAKYLIYDGSADPKLLKSNEPLEFEVMVESKDVARDYNITIIVTDSKKVMLQGASIRAYNAETNAYLTKNPLLTDADGKAVFSTDKAVYVTIAKSGFLPNYELDLNAGETRTAELAEVTDENSAAAKVTVLDSDGGLTEGAKVNILTEDGFFVGISEQYSLEDGTATISKTPVELKGEQARYIARASKGSVMGISGAFFLDSGETKEVVVSLAQAKGIAIINLKDATTQKTISTGKAIAYSRDTDEKIGECTVAAGSCPIIIPANKIAYFKITTTGFADLETEDFTVEPDQSKALDAALIPAALKNELYVSFEGIADPNGNGSYSRSYPAFAKGAYYNAKFLLNIPRGSDKAGLFVKVAGSETANAENDYASISWFEKPTDAIIMKGFSYRPGASCNGDMASPEDAGNKLAKWVNFEYLKQQATKAILVKIFVKPTAKAGDEVKIDFRAYAQSGKVFTRTPEDAELGSEQSTAYKDWCYAASNATKYTITEGRYVCSNVACMSLQFAAEGQPKVTKGFQVEFARPFKAYFSLRVLKEFSDSPYLKIYDDSEVKFGAYSVGGVEGNADGKGERTFELNSLSEGNEVAGEIGMMGTMPSAYSRMYMEFGDAEGPIMLYRTSITVTGTNEFIVQVVPAELQANEDKNLNVQLQNAVDGGPITDASVSIEEDESAAFDGATPGTVEGDGTEGYGKEGKYTFRYVHPYNTGSFLVVAKRDGFKNSEKKVDVVLNDFLEASDSSLNLDCSGSTIDLSNLLNAKVLVRAASSCMDINGENVNKVGNEAGFELKAKGSITLVLTPIKQGGSCDISFDAEAGDAHANLRIATKIACTKLPTGCRTDAECPNDQACNLETGTCKAKTTPGTNPPLPVNELVIGLDANYQYEGMFSLKDVADGSAVTGCEVMSQGIESQKMQNFVQVSCSGGNIQISADYSDAAYYAIPTPQMYTASQGPIYTAKEEPSILNFADEESRISFDPVLPDTYELDQPAPTATAIPTSFVEVQRGTLYLKFADRPQISIRLIVKGPEAPLNAFADSSVVYITSAGFEPADVWIPENGKIIWINKDTGVRTASSISTAFNTGEIRPNGNESHVFSQKGIYNYRDRTRAAVRGVIRVGDYESACKWKNKNYFAQKFVGYLTKSMVRYFEPQSGKSQQVAYSSVYKFYVSPNGIDSMVSPGLAPPGAYGSSFDGRTTQWNPADPRIMNYQQNYWNNYGADTTFSSTEDQGICETDGSAGFKCDIYLTPLLPVNGAAFTIINDYAMVSGTPSHLLVSKNSEFGYLSGAYADKKGTSGFIMGGLQQINLLFDIAPRYSTFILMNDPEKMIYDLTEDGKVQLKFADNGGDTEVEQHLTLRFGTTGQEFSIKMTFHILNDIGKYAIMEVPAGGDVVSRNSDTTYKEPVFLINNIPITELAVESSVNAQKGSGKFEQVIYTEPDFSALKKINTNLNRKAGDNAELNFPMPAYKLTSSDSVFDVVGNVGRDNFDEALSCSGVGFCNVKDYEAAYRKVQKEIEDWHEKVKVQRLDFAGFGETAANRIMDALEMTLKDYVADKAQYEICKAVSALQDGVCSNAATGATDYNCYDDAYCDNTVTGSEVWSVEKEQLGLTLCDSEFLSTFNAFATTGNWDAMKAIWLRKLLQSGPFMPRVQTTKPIVETGKREIQVMFKRAADSGQPQGYVLKSFKILTEENGGSIEGYMTLEDILSHKSATEAEQIAIKKAEIEALGKTSTATTTSGSRFKAVGLEGWKEIAPQYFYIDNTAGVAGNKIEIAGKPNLLTMNKYPFTIKKEAGGDALGIFDSDEMKKLVLPAKTTDKNAIKVVSCYVAYKSKAENTVESANNIMIDNETAFDNKCPDDTIKGMPAVITLFKVKQPIGFLSIGDNKLVIASALKSRPCTIAPGTTECKVEAALAVDYKENSNEILKNALKYLLSEQAAPPKVTNKLDPAVTKGLFEFSLIQGESVWLIPLDPDWGKAENVQPTAQAEPAITGTQTPAINVIKATPPEARLFIQDIWINYECKAEDGEVIANNYVKYVDPKKSLCVYARLNTKQVTAWPANGIKISVKAEGNAQELESATVKDKPTAGDGYAYAAIVIPSEGYPLNKKIYVEASSEGWTSGIGRYWFNEKGAVIKDIKAMPSPSPNANPDPNVIP
ncbi:MAG: hypothetical protein V1835_06775 [Candidatus Micrarchaeota archaeon]